MDQEQKQNRTKNTDQSRNKDRIQNKGETSGQDKAQDKNPPAKKKAPGGPPRQGKSQTPHKNRPRGGAPGQPAEQTHKNHTQGGAPNQSTEQTRKNHTQGGAPAQRRRPAQSGNAQGERRTQPGRQAPPRQAADKNPAPNKSNTPDTESTQTEAAIPNQNRAQSAGHTQMKDHTQNKKTDAVSANNSIKSQERTPGRDVRKTNVPAGSKAEHKKERTGIPGGRDNIEDSGRSVKQFPLPVNIHVILLGIIVLIAAFSAYRLYKWNKGVPSDYDPNYQTDAFDVEAMDNIIPLAPDKLEGHEDDGVTTILCLGDDPFSLNQGEGGLAEQIAAMTGATVYNGAFTGTTAAAQFESYNDGYILDAFSFSYVAQSLASGNFDLMKTAATYSYDEAFPKTTAMLESLDMNSIDVICIMYDASDYINMRPCDDPNAPNAIITYTGALRTGIQAIQEAYPHIRIAVMSHTFCHHVNEEGNFENGDRTDLGHGTLSHYLQKELDATSDCGVSFIDNFYGSINEDNYLEYMTDYIHFNDAGRKRLAERFVQSIFPELAQEGEDADKP